MAAVSIEEVIELVAEERSLAPQKVDLNSRLLHDLGMDGDDAVDFFEAFEKSYGPDLTPLYQHWSRHFGPEGCGPGPGGCLVLIALPWLPLLFIPFGVSPYWVWGAEVIALLIWLWPLKQWPLKNEMIPVTVQDLVIAAQTGRWPIKYGDA